MFTVTIWGSRGSMPTPGRRHRPLRRQYLLPRDPRRLEARHRGRRLGHPRSRRQARPRGHLKRGPHRRGHLHHPHALGPHHGLSHVHAHLRIPAPSSGSMAPSPYEEDSASRRSSAPSSPTEYWPVRQDELSAQDRVRADQGDGHRPGRRPRVRTKYLNHPVLCLGYRFEYEGDGPSSPPTTTSPSATSFRPIPPIRATTRRRPRRARRPRARRTRSSSASTRAPTSSSTTASTRPRNTTPARSASATPPTSSRSTAAHRCGVKRVLLFHHDPNRTDAELQELELFYQGKV